MQAAKTGEKASHMALTLKGKESLSSLLPKPPVATVDDTSTAKQELEKCYKRIADLETRIHDLTLQNSIVSYKRTQVDGATTAYC